MNLVLLPSGALAPLETPGLLPLLAGDGSLVAIARATLAHEEVDAAALTTEDQFAVAAWGLEGFAGTDDAALLAAVGEAFHVAPSYRLQVREPSLAWLLDRDCLGTLRQRQAREAGDDAEPQREGVLVCSVPDVWSDDDDD